MRAHRRMDSPLLDCDTSLAGETRSGYFRVIIAFGPEHYPVNNNAGVQCLVFEVSSEK